MVCAGFEGRKSVSLVFFFSYCKLTAGCNLILTCPDHYLRVVIRTGLLSFRHGFWTTFIRTIRARLQSWRRLLTITIATRYPTLLITQTTVLLSAIRSNHLLTRSNTFKRSRTRHNDTTTHPHLRPHHPTGHHPPLPLTPQLHLLPHRLPKSQIAAHMPILHAPPLRRHMALSRL
jgi:hypothetical protein